MGDFEFGLNAFYTTIWPPACGGQKVQCGCLSKNGQSPKDPCVYALGPYWQYCSGMTRRCGPCWRRCIPRSEFPKVLRHSQCTLCLLRVDQDATFQWLLHPPAAVPSFHHHRLQPYGLVSQITSSFCKFPWLQCLVTAMERNLIHQVYCARCNRKTHLFFPTVLFYNTECVYM